MAGPNIRTRPTPVISRRPGLVIKTRLLLGLEHVQDDLPGAVAPARPHPCVEALLRSASGRSGRRRSRPAWRGCQGIRTVAVAQVAGTGDFHAARIAGGVGGLRLQPREYSGLADERHVAVPVEPRALPELAAVGLLLRDQGRLVERRIGFA